MFRHSSNTLLSAGLFFSLTCMVTANMPGVDTHFTAQSSITGSGISDTNGVNVFQLVLVQENVYEKTVTFNHLIEVDTGSYNCLAFVTSSHVYVIARDLTSTTETVSVESKHDKFYQ